MIDVIGFHGQTVLHRPDEALTVQLGDGALLARRNRHPVVYDMRANDMVHGGQGAPLDSRLSRGTRRGSLLDCDAAGRCFVNIGGISNLTFIGAEWRDRCL